jgi:hypothetical protein
MTALVLGEEKRAKPKPSAKRAVPIRDGGGGEDHAERGEKTRLDSI